MNRNKLIRARVPMCPVCGVEIRKGIWPNDPANWYCDGACQRGFARPNWGYYAAADETVREDRDLQVVWKLKKERDAARIRALAAVAECDRLRSQILDFDKVIEEVTIRAERKNYMTKKLIRAIILMCLVCVVAIIALQLIGCTTTPSGNSFINEIISVDGSCVDEKIQAKVEAQHRRDQAILEKQRKECEACKAKLKKYGPVAGCSIGLDATLSMVKRILVAKGVKDPITLGVLMGIFRLECISAELKENIYDTPRKSVY